MNLISYCEDALADAIKNRQPETDLIMYFKSSACFKEYRRVKGMMFLEVLLEKGWVETDWDYDSLITLSANYAIIRKAVWEKI